MRTAWPDDSSIPGLLGTGNLQPPRIFEKGEVGLLRHLETRDFRGAICVSGCDAPLAACIASHTKGTVDFKVKSGDVTGDPEFEVAASFSCD